MMQTMQFRAMNTDILLAAEGGGAVEGMQTVKTFIDDCEQRFSRFLPESELSRLNRSAGEWVHVSNDLLEMLRISINYYFETKGIFDPSILTDLKWIGYVRSMDEIRAGGATLPPLTSKRGHRPAFHEMTFHPADNRVRLPRNMEVDLGGIAKGWIVEKAAYLLNTYSSACGVSAGGDMFVIGHPSDGMHWEVALEDPSDPTRTLRQLRVSSGAVTTSSVMKRTWRQGEEARHHLIDPRTGESARTDWLSVTVISPDIITAEVYAKAILIGGEGELKNLLEARPDLTFIAVDPDGNLLGTPNYKDFTYESTTDALSSIGIAD